MLASDTLPTAAPSDMLRAEAVVLASTSTCGGGGGRRVVVVVVVQDGPLDDV